MLKAYPFKEWLPDQVGSGLSEAVNVRAVAGGYAPIKQFQAITPTLGAAFNGGGAFIDSSGLSTLLASTTAKIRKYTGSAWADVLVVASTQVNRFAQFGDNVLIANGGALVSYALIAGTTSTPPAAPNAIDVARVRDFVMVITDDNQVQWSQFNDSGNWTLGANQADNQPILASSGVRLIGGEYGILLCKEGIWRLNYVGAAEDVIFQFDEISAETGCMAPGSVCNVGRLGFFLSERGFMLCDGQEVIPIGDEKFNRWFFDTYSREEIANIWSAVDPRHSLVLWGMPATTGRLIAYNWVLKRATVIETGLTGLFTGYTSAVSLDSLDAIYGDLDHVTVSLDDISLQGGNPILLVADTANQIGALTGDSLQAKLKLDNIEPTPGKRSRIRSVRLISDTNEASVAIDARMRAGDTESIRSTATMRLNGKLPIRANGRYNSVEPTIPAGTDWSFIQGCELEFEAGDGR